MDDNTSNQISNLRVLATLSVVFYHSICYYGMWPQFGDGHAIKAYMVLAPILNSFNMPIFSLISGFLYHYLYSRRENYRDTPRFIKEKAKRLLVPFLAWGIVNYMLFSQYCSLSFFCSDSFLHLWFLQMLFNVFVIVACTSRIWTKTGLFADCILLFCLYAITINGSLIYHNKVLNIDSALRYLPVFYTGMMLDKYSMLQKATKIKGLLFVTSITSLLLYIVLIKLVRIGTCFPQTCLIVVLLLGIYKLNFRRLNSYLDRNSMGIYILHHIIIWILIVYTPFQSVAASMWYLMPVILAVTSIVGSLVITYAIHKTKFSKYLIG